MIIPKTLHQVWIGPNRIPEHYYKLMRTWTTLYPDWVYNLWTDETLPKLVNQKAFDALGSYTGRSDIARYEILYEHGGMYCDLDYEALQNMEPLIQDAYIFFATEYHKDGLPAITGSLFGAVPHHPHIKRIIDALPGNIISKRNRSIVEQVGPPVVNATLGDAANLTRIAPEHVSPYEWWNEANRDPKPPGAFAIHHYHGSWLPKE